MSGLRAPKAGSNRDAQAKIDASFDCDDAKKVLYWIQAATGERVPITDSDNKAEVMNNFHLTLQDGFLLCKLANAFLPPDQQFDMSTRTFRPSKSQDGLKSNFESARERERIDLFNMKIQEFGVSEQDTFQTDCLYERTNLSKVISTIRVFGIMVEAQPSYTGQKIWPRKSEANPRHFSEEKLRASQNVISLQYGTNKGASQAGMNFGKKRMILQNE